MPLLGIRIFYNLVLFLLLPIFIPFVVYRLFIGKETAESIAVKLGLPNKKKCPKGGIWIHAVSVGEVNAALPLAELLVSRGKKVLFSVGTQTGMSVARNRLKDKVFLTWFPFDFPFAVNSVLGRLSPSVAVMLETEIWPNFILKASESGVKCVVANGRISDGSFENYKKLRWFFAPVLKKMDLFLMQTETDAERAYALGADKKNVVVAGNVKFDLPPPKPSGKEAAMERFNIPPGTKVLVFASTHPGEEDAFLEVAKNISDHENEVFTVVAPRHVERAAEVVAICEKKKFIPVTRSSGQNCAKGSLLVLDTIGELAGLYEAADIAVIGGSFIRHGGQNPLEASVWGRPVVFGPHMENFREISQKLLSAGGARQVETEEELENILYDWLKNPAKAKEVGEKGRETVNASRGALEKIANRLEELSTTHRPE